MARSAALLALTLVAACGQSTGALGNLPTCTGTALFTVAPLADSDFVGLVPLGNLNPPGHTLPTDHIYFYLRPGVNPGDPPQVAPVRAPAAVHIVYLTSTAHLDTTGATLYEDYSFTFASCREVSMYYGHVESLAPTLQAQTGGWDNCNDNPNGGFRYCSKNLDLVVAAGDTLGTAGGVLGQNALDLGAHDARITPLAYANPARYSHAGDGQDAFHVVCPIDLYAAGPGDSLRSRFSNYNGTVPRTVDPKCGSAMQDIAGTAQGAWYVNTAGATEDWSKHLALVHDNVDPTKGAIAVGGTITTPFALTFTPTHAGTTDREPSEITPGGGATIYCYTLPAGRLLVSLTTATALTVEQQAGTCGGGYAFSTPTGYVR